MSYGEYVLKMVWPTRLVPLDPFHPDAVSTSKAVLAAVALASVSALAVKLRRRCPYLVVGWLWYLGTLAPVSNIVQQGTQRMADRYVYVPLIGLFIMIAWGVPHLLRQWRYKQLGLGLAGSAVIAILTVCTVSQVTHWRDFETLFRYTIRVMPDNAVAHNNLGCALLEQGKPEEAARHFKKAVEIYPSYTTALLNLAAALTEMEVHEGAAQIYAMIVEEEPENTSARFHLGLTLAILGRREEAIVEFEEVLRLDPARTEAQDWLDALRPE